MTGPGFHKPVTGPMKKGSRSFPFCKIWSGKRGSNSRPQPWQGCALPTELFPHRRACAPEAVTSAAHLTREGQPLPRGWSGKRGSNSRPQPWQGCALPTELFPRRGSVATAFNICFATSAELAILLRDFQNCQRFIRNCFESLCRNPLLQASRVRAVWRRGAESNRPGRICNPLHNRFATAPSFRLRQPGGHRR